MYFLIDKEILTKSIIILKRQEEHHAKKSLKEEYFELLKEFEIDNDEQYIFNELE